MKPGFMSTGRAVTDGCVTHDRRPDGDAYLYSPIPRLRRILCVYAPTYVYAPTRVYAPDAATRVLAGTDERHMSRIAIRIVHAMILCPWHVSIWCSKCYEDNEIKERNEIRTTGTERRLPSTIRIGWRLALSPLAATKKAAVPRRRARTHSTPAPPKPAVPCWGDRQRTLDFRPSGDESWREYTSRENTPLLGRALVHALVHAPQLRYVVYGEFCTACSSHPPLIFACLRQPHPRPRPRHPSHA